MGRPNQAPHMQARCDAFNATNKVGDVVRYWTGLREGEGRKGAIQHEAQIMGGHTAVVYITGAGSVALTHVEAIPDAEREISRLLGAARLWLDVLIEAADIEPDETVMTVKVRDKDGVSVREIKKSLADTIAEIDAHQPKAGA